MKKAKKLLAWLLTAVIVSSSLPFSVFADETNQPSAAAEDASGFEVSFDLQMLKMSLKLNRRQLLNRQLNQRRSQ